MVRARVDAASLVLLVGSLVASLLGSLIGSQLGCGRSESPPAAPAPDAAPPTVRDGGAALPTALLVSDGRTVRVADEPTAARVAERLRELRVYTGSADGRDHAGLVLALKEFQAARGLPATGVLDPQTADALGVRVPPVGPPGT